jgi:hypothetical protein
MTDYIGFCLIMNLNVNASVMWSAKKYPVKLIIKGKGLKDIKVKIIINKRP